MVEDVKKTRKPSHVFLTIAIGFLIMAVIIWTVYYRGRGYDSNAVAHVDGTIETSDSAVAKAYQKISDSDPASVIQNQDSEETKVGLIIEGVNEKVEENEKIRSILKDANMKATYALSGSESLEDKDYTKELMNDRFAIICNGTTGEANLHLKDTEKMVEIMLKSREAVSNAVNANISMFYSDSTEMTGDILKAASASGYDTVIDADESQVLDRSSFNQEEDATEFVNSIHGNTIVVFNVRGIVEKVENESTVVAEKPAVDKQADLDDTQAEEKTVPEVSEQIQWLVNAIQQYNLETEYVTHFEKTDGLYALREQVEQPDADKAIVYRYCLTDKNQIGFGLKGIPDTDEFQSFEKKNEIPLTAFATEDELEKYDQIHSSDISLGMIVCENDLKDKSATEIFDDLYRKMKSYEKRSDFKRTVLIDNVEKESLDKLRIVAKQLNLILINPKDEKKIKSGYMYVCDSEKLDNLNSLKNKATQKKVICSDIYDLIHSSGKISKISTNELRKMREENQEEKAEVKNMVYTTDRVASFNFYNLGNNRVMEDVLSRLSNRNAKGTFYVTLNELMNRNSVIEDILSSGNEIGIHYQVSTEYPETFSSVCNYLNSWKKYAEWAYDIDSSLVFVTNSDLNDELEEAVHVSDCQIIKNTLLVVRNEDKDLDLDHIQDAMDRLSNVRLMRGGFVFFNTNFYANDKDADYNSVIGAVLDAYMDQYVDTAAYRNVSGEIEDASRFTICTSSELLNTDHQYTFNTEEQNDITMDKNVLTSMSSDEERFAYIRDHYYGNVTVNEAAKLPGFTADEIEQLDKKGSFTDDRVLFLTFDDWGTEESINELLYVLDKYNVKATFFVKTNYVDTNPNLLRKIAEDGHQIACHTDGHIPLADSVNGNDNHTTSLTDEEAQSLREDIVLSYNKLNKYVGDVEVNGKKALTRMFRPPTLAVSKIGLEQVFDTGFEYSISGEYSTGDYEASSYEDMIDRLTQREIGYGQNITVDNGTVIVMHMQENAKYTAQALDTMIPKWQEEGYSFARIDDYLSD